MNNLAKIRTDVVGSLLRPANLKDARVRLDDGKISGEELRAVEEEAVRAAVRVQEDAGLDVVTDGEQRRLNFQDSFGASVEGYDATRSTLKAYERRVEGSAPLRRWDIPEIQQAGTACPIADRPKNAFGSRTISRSKNTASSAAWRRSRLNCR
jgi:5-methyltetrahydropteroyltriglutamate--homocysteine methyltransferase